jgi:hypothetical protein
LNEEDLELPSYQMSKIPQPQEPSTSLNRVYVLIGQDLAMKKGDVLALSSSEIILTISALENRVLVKMEVLTCGAQTSCLPAGSDVAERLVSKLSQQKQSKEDAEHYPTCSVQRP